MKVCKQNNHHRIHSCENSVINGVYCLVLQSNLLFLGRREAAGTQSRLRRDRGDTRGLRRERTLYLWREVWYLTELNPVAWFPCVIMDSSLFMSVSIHLQDERKVKQENEMFFIFQFGVIYFFTCWCADWFSGLSEGVGASNTSCIVSSIFWNETNSNSWVWLKCWNISTVNI